MLLLQKVDDAIQWKKTSIQLVSLMLIRWIVRDSSSG